MTIFGAWRSKKLMNLPAAEREKEFERQRLEMVRTQIERRGVRDEAVLEAMRKVPRHRFIPESLWVEAYQDCPLPIGYDQTVSQPYIVALMTELLRVGPGDKVLEIGTGSGYQAAILAEIGCEVYTLEIVEPLAERARAVLRELGYTNVHIYHADGSDGLPEHAPYDGCIVTAAPADVPKPLIDQLAEGKRLVIPMGKLSQDLYVIEKTADGINQRSIIPVRFVPMTGRVSGKRKSQ